MTIALVTKIKAFVKWVNWSMVSTLLSIIIAIVVGVQYFTGLKHSDTENAKAIETLAGTVAKKADAESVIGEFKVLNARLDGINKALDGVNEQLGELRRAHLVVANTVQVQGQSIKSNTRNIEDTKVVLKTLPEVVTNKVLEHPQVLAVTKDVKKKSLQ